MDIYYSVQSQIMKIQIPVETLTFKMKKFGCEKNSWSMEKETVRQDMHK